MRWGGTRFRASPGGMKRPGRGSERSSREEEAEGRKPVAGREVKAPLKTRVFGARSWVGERPRKAPSPLSCAEEADSYLGCPGQW